jgi:hypothetical protein
MVFVADTLAGVRYNKMAKKQNGENRRGGFRFLLRA